MFEELFGSALEFAIGVNPSQNLGIHHTAPSGGLSCREIHPGPTAPDSRQNRLGQIGTGQKPNLHDALEPRNSSLARVSLCRRLAGRDSALRLPSVHFCRWRNRYASMLDWFAK